MYEGFARIYDRFIAQTDQSSWANYLQELFMRHGKSGVLRITDAACGSGGITIPLAGLGHSLVGMDLSEDMLALAALKARQSGVKIPFICQSLQELSPHRRQDVINCSNDGVNYLTDLDEVSAFFGHAYTSLNTGGLLCFDISSRWKIENLLAGNTYGEADADLVYLWKNAYDPESLLLEMELTFFSTENGTDYKRGSETHLQRAHSTEEVMELLSECGFAQAFAYDAFTLLPPKPDSERIQFVAVK